MDAPYQLCPQNRPSLLHCCLFMIPDPEECFLVGDPPMNWPCLTSFSLKGRATTNWEKQMLPNRKGEAHRKNSGISCQCSLCALFESLASETHVLVMTPSTLYPMGSCALNASWSPLILWNYSPSYSITEYMEVLWILKIFQIEWHITASGFLCAPHLISHGHERTVSV